MRNDRPEYDNNYDHISGLPDSQFRQIPAKEMLQRATCWNLRSDSIMLCRIVPNHKSPTKRFKVRERAFTDETKMHEWIKSRAFIDKIIDVTITDNGQMQSFTAIVEGPDPQPPKQG